MEELDSNAVCQHVQTFNDRWFHTIVVKNSIVVLGQAIINDIVEVWVDRGVLA